MTISKQNDISLEEQNTDEIEQDLFLLKAFMLTQD